MMQVGFARVIWAEYIAPILLKTAATPKRARKYPQITQII